MNEEPKKRKPNAYILALKEFNKGKSMWCIPKKGSEDHKEVTRMKEKIQKGESVAKKEENVIVHNEKKVQKKVKEIEKKEENVIVHNEKKVQKKVKEIEKKIEKKEESFSIPVQKRYDSILSEFKELDKSKWEKLSPQQQRYVIRSIVDDLPQYAQMLNKKNPFPDMKSLPKYIHKTYIDFIKQ